MKLHELQSVEGSRRDSYRKGRGIGSGNGKTAGKGHKGQNARSGGGVRLGFEGGQLPLYRRLPKRGFKNVNHKRYATVNVSLLNRFEDETVVTPALLKDTGLVTKVGSLETRLEAVTDSISSVFKYKGAKDSYSDLLLIDTPSTGDVWSVGEAEYAWNGTDWIELGVTTSVDLSDYAKKVDLETV